MPQECARAPETKNLNGLILLVVFNSKLQLAGLLDQNRQPRSFLLVCPRRLRFTSVRRRQGPIKGATLSRCQVPTTVALWTWC